jgi:hypothetical protein
MTRSQWNPSDFGLSVDREEFVDQMCEQFNSRCRSQYTIDELLLHPHEAIQFCEDVRQHFGYVGLPDDIILRVIMGRRKNPNE